MDDYIENGQFSDVHAWQFIPASFEMIISDLSVMDLVKLELVASFDTEGYEFFASLCKNDVSYRNIDIPRISLAKQVMIDGSAICKQSVSNEKTLSPQQVSSTKNKT